jgi:hypothetical protein
MKARITFYCFAVVALVLILAAAPSHATDRRDPIFLPEPVAGSTHAMSPAQTMWQSSNQKKMPPRATPNARNTQHPAKEKPVKNRNHRDAPMGSNSAAK